MNVNARGFARALQSRQRQAHMIGFRVDGTGTASILAGSREATLTDNGVGDYTLTFSVASQRLPIVMGIVPLTDNVYAQVSSLSVSAVRILIKQVADGATATDADFHVSLMVFDAADEV